MTVTLIKTVRSQKMFSKFIQTRNSKRKFEKLIYDEDQKTIKFLRLVTSTGDKNAVKYLCRNLSRHVFEIKNQFGHTVLMTCILDEHLECASILLKYGARVDNSDNTGQTALHLAINKGSHQSVKLLLANGAQWQQTDHFGVTALHAAAANNSTKCLYYILKVLLPGQVDTLDNFKKTSLHWSAALGKVENLKLLLKQGANVCIPDSKGKTPLHWAATSPFHRAVECAKLILGNEPSLINWQEYRGCSALHFAVSSGSIQMVEYLVKWNLKCSKTSRETCNINSLDNTFSTPLHWAACQGLEDKIALLLDRGAVYSCLDEYGFTAMHYAALCNHTGAMKAFLTRSYITDSVDRKGRNCLIVAAEAKAHDVIQLLCDFGVDINFKDYDGMTALHAVVMHNYFDTTKLLLECHSSVDEIDNDGMTPFLRACKHGLFRIADLLLANKACLSSIDNRKRSALHWAAYSGNAYLCQTLIQLGCNVNDQDHMGMVPLHYCFKTGVISCVSVLLESEADPNIVANCGKSPLHFAAEGNNFYCAEILIDWGADVNIMALLHSWYTPLDATALNNNLEVAYLLRSRGGLTGSDIEIIAANKIKSWFLKMLVKQRAQKKVSASSDSNSKVKADPIGSNRMQTNISHQNVLKQKIGLQLDIAFSPTHQGTLSMKYTNVFNSIHYNADEIHAAVTIQRAWRKFMIERKVMFMHQNIMEAFTNNCRKCAERNWEISLKQFENQVYEVSIREENILQ